MRQLVRNLLPPLLWRALCGLRLINPTQYGLFGAYTSWDEAVRVSTGYDSKIILEKTKAALLKVKNGKAVYERDSVIFSEVQYAWPLLACLMWAAAQSGGKLNVLDFGGSLGSTYFQNRTFLRHLAEVRWNIVEQPHYVKTGKEYFENGHLKFYESIEAAIAKVSPNVVLLSSVLQYLEQPYDLLKKLLGLHLGYIIIDRTPFWDGPTDRLCVQKVHPSIYAASYPCWIFSSKRFREHLQDAKIIAEFTSPDRLEAPVHCTWKGMITAWPADEAEDFVKLTDQCF